MSSSASEFWWSKGDTVHCWYRKRWLCPSLISKKWQIPRQGFWELSFWFSTALWFSLPCPPPPAPLPPCFPCDLVSEADYNPKTSALSYFTSQAFLCLGFCTCCSFGLQALLLFLPHRLTCPNLLFWLIHTHSPGQPSRNSLPQTRAGTSLELYARLFSVIAHDHRFAFLPCRARSAASRLDSGTALCLFLKP